ncbi:hypothetical protein SAMN06265222_101121 [Neorhodopirellula lusitana]|uniref:Uncharacterized protein n=1 Tax=Neorhodopirellula lusitana TaxID=445327 RepID=A0ABY1PNB5_9BACT|nr:hypothetical protein SAMN06265222_101121 [Neorhodopirellula lusitana]
MGLSVEWHPSASMARMHMSRATLGLVSGGTAQGVFSPAVSWQDLLASNNAGAQSLFRGSVSISGPSDYSGAQ